MIQKYIYEVLKADQTDNDYNTALLEAQELNNEIINLDNIEYYYKCLKTLCNDTNAEWYKRKIFIDVYSKEHQNNLDSDDNLPKILIECKNANRSKSNSGRDLESLLYLSVRVNGTSGNPNRQLLNIVYRIKKLLEPNHGHTCILKSDYALSGLNLYFEGLESVFYDFCTLRYKAVYSFY